MLYVGSGSGDEDESLGDAAGVVAASSVFPPEGSVVGSPEQAVRASADSAAVARTIRARVITSLKRTQQMLPQRAHCPPSHTDQVKQPTQLLTS